LLDCAAGISIEKPIDDLFRRLVTFDMTFDDLFVGLVTFGMTLFRTFDDVAVTSTGMLCSIEEYF